MNFTDAVSNMCLGRKLVRPSWTGFYVTVISGQSYIWQIGNTNATPQPNAVEYVPSLSDITATDWSVKST